MAEGAPTIDALVARNKRIAATAHRPLPLLRELPAPAPALTLVLTCADPRLEPAAFLGLGPGEAVVFRSVAGHPDHLLTEMAGISAFMDIAELMVVHHSDCGASHFKDPSLRTELTRRAPARMEELAATSFGAFTDFEESVREDVRLVRNCDLFTEQVRKNTRGFLFDLKTGLLNEVTV